MLVPCRPNRKAARAACECAVMGACARAQRVHAPMSTQNPFWIVLGGGIQSRGAFRDTIECINWISYFKSAASECVPPGPPKYGKLVEDNVISDFSICMINFSKNT